MEEQLHSQMDTVPSVRTEDALARHERKNGCGPSSFSPPLEIYQPSGVPASRKYDASWACSLSSPFILYLRSCDFSSLSIDLSFVIIRASCLHRIIFTIIKHNSSSSRSRKPRLLTVAFRICLEIWLGAAADIPTAAR